MKSRYIDWVVQSFPLSNAITLCTWHRKRETMNFAVMFFFLLYVTMRKIIVTLKFMSYFNGHVFRTRIYEIKCLYWWLFLPPPTPSIQLDAVEIFKFSIVFCLDDVDKKNFHKQCDILGLVFKNCSDTCVCLLPKLFTFQIKLIDSIGNVNVSFEWNRLFYV